jgi:hypothetical protein
MAGNSGVQEVEFQDIETGDRKCFDQGIKLFCHFSGDRKFI